MRRERVQGSAHARDGRFRNLANVKPDLKGLAPSIAGEFMFAGGKRAPRGALPSHDPRPAWARAAETGLRVSWLGHSTLYIESDGVRILTDPVFGERASPVSFLGPRRYASTPVSIAELPEFDVLLLSHDHYDHLCRMSIQELAKRNVHVVTALGVGTHLEAYGVAHDRVHELDWHESVELPGVRFTATPAQHFSGRGMGDRNATLWASWVIQTARRKLFFSGDTGLFPELADIGKQFGPFDLTMLEIGAYHPAWGDIHLGPANALVAHQMLGGGTLLPVHWGTFDLALHTWCEPAEELYVGAAAHGARLIMPELGQVLEPDRAPEIDPWWRRVGG
ncbi:MAG TPA: MBL fold metallo-hydrolase [Polyangiales bacterium]|nr:MBL fold metallo-hydrolase [Polyangiales bacterium]